MKIKYNKFKNNNRKCTIKFIRYRRSLKKYVRINWIRISKISLAKSTNKQMKSIYTEALLLKDFSSSFSKSSLVRIKYFFCRNKKYFFNLKKYIKI